MGSTRLPGKVMLPLGDHLDLEHVIHRVQRASEIDEVVVATTTKTADDIIEWCSENAGATVFRGDEQNVLDRMYRAAKTVEADEIVRITADCPLIDPTVIDAVVRRRRASNADYVSNILERTFPRGLDVEVFTAESFERVHSHASTSSQLEHVTLYYRDNSDEFEFANVTSAEVFDQEQLQNRTDLRLTLDEAQDYLLLREIFEQVDYENTPQLLDVIEYIDKHGLGEMNETVIQKSTHDASRN